MSILALVIGLLSLGTSAATADDTTPPAPTYPTAQGWTSQPVGVQYHIDAAAKTVQFWSTQAGTEAYVANSETEGAIPRGSYPLASGGNGETVTVAMLCGRVTRLYVSGQNPYTGDTANGYYTLPSLPCATPYPTAQGWTNQLNGVQYHIDHKTGYVQFWGTQVGNYPFISFDGGALPGSSYNLPPAGTGETLKLKMRCGVTTEITINGYGLREDRMLPAWSCPTPAPYSKGISVKRVQKVNRTTLRVSGRLASYNKAKIVKVVLYNVTKTTRTRCAWTNPVTKRVRYTPRASGRACDPNRAPVYKLVPKRTTWSVVVRKQPRHGVRVIAVVVYPNPTVVKRAVWPRTVR